MSRRLALAAFALPVLLLFVPATAIAGPREDLFESWKKFLALKSFRASINTLEPSQLSSQMEFQAPDRYRMSIPNGPTTVMVGDTAYMTIGGRSMKLPLPVKSMTAQYRDEAFLQRLQAGLVVENLGHDTLDGEPVRKLRYVQDAQPPPAMPGAAPAAGATGKATTVAWISVKSGLILRLEVSARYRGQDSRTEIRYSGFNDPTINIQPPK